STAYFFLEGLNEIGIDYLFCNFGTDHAPIIEELAHRRSRGDKLPSIVRCPHENTAAHMAAGYAFVTGRGQGVLVHVDVGTANTATAMQQYLPQPASGAADGRQGAVHHRQRTRGLARYLRALRAGAVRSGEPRSPLPQVGVDAAVRHRGEGG